MGEVISRARRSGYVQRDTETETMTMSYADHPASREIIEADIQNELRWMREMPEGSHAQQGCVNNISKLMDRLEDPLEGD